MPLRVIARQGPRDVHVITELAEREEVGRIVVGLPIALDGREGPQAEQSRAFAEALRGATRAEVVLYDERLSSVEADRHLHAAGLRGKDAKAARDATAAAIILQSYLDSRTMPPLPPIA